MMPGVSELAREEAEGPDFTAVRAACGNALAINGRVAYSTLAYKQAHLRLGTVEDFRLDFRKRPEVLISGDHGRGVWKSPRQVVCINED
jgi:hypothetical protein